jgi:hypothetical protein
MAASIWRNIIGVIAQSKMAYEKQYQPSKKESIENNS